MKKSGSVNKQKSKHANFLEPKHELQLFLLDIGMQAYKRGLEDALEFIGFGVFPEVI